MQDPKNFGCLAYAFVPAEKDPSENNELEKRFLLGTEMQTATKLTVYSTQPRTPSFIVVLSNLKCHIFLNPRHLDT